MNTGSGEGARAALADHIYLDAMGFGMGCCCLQVVPAMNDAAVHSAQMTFQGRSIDEARYLYDQLAVMTPIMLALSGVCCVTELVLILCSGNAHSARTPFGPGLPLGHHLWCGDGAA